MKTSLNTDRLIAGYFAGDLSNAQLAELQELLRNDPDTRHRLAEIARQDVLLRRIMTARQAAEPADRFEESDAPVSLTPRERQMGRRLRWLPPLAAAATLLITVGLFRLLDKTDAPDVFAAGRLTHSLGSPSIQNASTDKGPTTSIQTPAGAFCRLDHPDGSILGVSESTRVLWAQSSTNGQKTLDILQGQIYLDMAKQNKPLLIRYPSTRMQTDVIGTRLVTDVQPNGQERVHVIKGRVRIRSGVEMPLARVSSIATHDMIEVPCNQATVYLLAGQSSAYAPMGKTRTLFIHPGGLFPGAPAWLNRLGMDPAGLSDAPSQPTLQSGGLLDPSMVTVITGTWRFERQNNSVAAFHDPARVHELAAATFGAPVWAKGDFSCKLRMPAFAKAEREYDIGIGPAFYSHTIDAPLINKTTVDSSIAGVHHMRVSFEVMPDRDTIMLRHYELWTDTNPDRRLSWKDLVVKGVSGDSPLTAIAPGVFVTGIPVEFFDLRLENAVPAASATLPPAKRE